MCLPKKSMPAQAAQPAIEAKAEISNTDQGRVSQLDKLKNNPADLRGARKTSTSHQGGPRSLLGSDREGKFF